MERSTQIPGFPTLTSGDIARSLAVDLKTVHRWVQKGRLRGQRTRGGHLRFHRVEVVRFLRGRRLQIPQGLSIGSPRILAVRLPPLMQHRWATEYLDGLFDALVELMSSDYDVVAVNLDRLDTNAAAAFVRALRSRAATQSVGLVVVSQWADRRRALLAAGADISVPSPHELPAAIRYVVGITPQLENQNTANAPRVPSVSQQLPRQRDTCRADEPAPNSAALAS